MATDRAALPAVTVYTDGACSPNPGVGGWGAVLLSPRHGARRELSGAEDATTNNRMELTAALEALAALTRPCAVTLCTDSRYLMNAFEARWLEKWQRNGWLTAERKPVQNADLWRRLLERTAVHEVSWQWVAGHGDDVENNRADALAVAAREALAARLRDGGR